VSAEDDGRDVQHIDDPGQGDGQRSRRRVDGVPGGRVTPGGARAQLVGPGVERQARRPHQCVPARVLLEAPGGTAAARRPGGVDAHVPHLAGPARTPGHDTPAQDGGAADADLAGQVDEVLQRAGPPGCPLRHRASGEIGLVAEDDR
jgi:hypothetical protein